MIRGRVRGGREPLIRHLRRRMALRRAGEVEIELADGRRVLQAAFLGEISFDGRQRTVLVTLTRSTDSLIGTSLLAGKTVRVEFVRGGTVVVS